ncbi:M50 family metallopeptidase [Nocardioides sp. YIM 152315]|uniref:site-2 protease family protein n=1 Tax=Nocardioides sp. YIM 152315 TaxID=3031760 RepID=UPI0023DBD3D0|nr:M50 family metallopeptidase [Nocardioides sp. YIM 152315]MDF1602449.1 M50 family metallopeptidase [Nocardioides sp. YIM 152315]
MPDSPARRPGTFRIGTVAGSDVLVSSSWFVVAGLIAIIVAPRIEASEPGLGAWKYVAGFAFAVILYLSVLLHEASHAIMARRFGFPVGSITLHFLGGMTTIEGEAHKPRQEFLIAVVGPLTSLAVGLAALALWFVTPDGLLLVAVEGLAGANLLVGLLNLVPGLPLDGGRVLKALVWRISGNAHRGTIVAGWTGRVTAGAVILWPVFQEQLTGVETTILDFALAFIVAAFLWTGATAAMSTARLRSRLPRLVGRQLARRTLAVPGDLPLAEAVRRAREAEAGSLVTVTSSGVPVGIVSEAAVNATPEDRRPWVATSTVARTLDDALQLPAAIAGEELVTAISRQPATEYLLVEDDGSICGVLATADVDRAFRAGGH